MNVLSLIGRESPLFESDIREKEPEIREIISSSRFLVLGGAGSIGQAVTKEIFKRNPVKLHVVDISENNLVELVRDLRSSYGYKGGEFKTYSLDIGSKEYKALIRADGQYDYVLNLSALKHVRSEKDPYTLMRMINVNILNTAESIEQSINAGVGKYFCVSTDKAANPINMMGASKKIMEQFLMRRSNKIDVSTARFANVAFSDGSLLHGFNQRLAKRQPIVAPSDIKRYFMTSKESGELCLMSCLFGNNRDIFFPRLSKEYHLDTFTKIAERYLKEHGYIAHVCKSEEEARDLMDSMPSKGYWPCLHTESDTTGEKEAEEFYTTEEVLELDRFESIGVIQNSGEYDEQKLLFFEKRISELQESSYWDKDELVKLFYMILSNFRHSESGKDLDGKM